MNNKGRLLVLDDEHDVGVLICSIARHIDYEATAQTDPEVFFEQLRNWAPSHVVVDLQMPGVDGVETLKRLAELDCDSAVIITSGLGSRVLAAAARAATENGLRVGGVLPKPFTPGHLRALLDNPVDSGSAGPVSAGSGSAITPDDLSLALERRELSVFFQPKISCQTGAIVGVESLARWMHPGKGAIPPDVFIPMAEQHELIERVTMQVFDLALAWFARNLNDSAITLALNLSARNLHDPGFPLWLLNRCDYFGIHPSRLVLEITETSGMDDPTRLLEYLTQFRIKGFSLSIDDFGVGYSSLIQLARLPFSEMKIDKTFVMSAARSDESQKICNAIIGLAHALGLKVVAEGVEDEWSLTFLKYIGCDVAQGYFIARPMSPGDTVAWISCYSPVEEVH